MNDRVQETPDEPVQHLRVLPMNVLAAKIGPVGEDVFFHRSNAALLTNDIREKDQVGFVVTEPRTRQSRKPAMARQILPTFCHQDGQIRSLW
jgi:hypothetical protein